MFSRLFALLPVAALAAVAAAAPNDLEARNDGSCNTGDEYCCTQKFKTPITFTGINPVGTLINAVVGAGVPIGIECTPITLIGVGSGGQCITQTACCTGNTQTGLVNVQCVPVAAQV